MRQTSNRLRVAVAQLNFRVGDVDRNTERMLESMDRARQRDADLIVFSELGIFGYPPRDMVHRRQLVDRQLEGLERIASATDDELAAVVGVVVRQGDGTGHDLINAAAFCGGGDVEQIVAKQLLPNYDVFDEQRYFDAPSTDGVVSWKGTSIGLTICEDAWCRVDQDEIPTYDDDPIGRCVDAGAEVVVNISASPFSLGKGRFRRELLAEHCRRHDRPLLFVNQVGANDELIFDGRSLALDADGEIAARLSEFEQDLQLVEVGAGPEVTGLDEEPIRPVAGSRAGEARDAIVLGIRDYTEKSGFDGAIVGMSGGIDSSVGTTLVADALGADRVRGVAMPSRFSSDHSREDARLLGENLGIEFDEIGIDDPYQSILETLQPHFGDTEFGVAEENIQARVRGLYLMALSNKSGRLVMACGNKSELAVGYCTLYGDMNGALAIIGDLPKMLVYEIARLYNDEAQRDLIPERVLEKPPSAELRPDQKDEDSLPSYEVLDEILERYLVETATIAEIVEEGFDEQIVREVVGLIHRNEYKRWQAPPVLRVTDKAFGTGWRYPLAASYER